MKQKVNMKFLPILIMILMLCGITGMDLVSCKGCSSLDGDDSAALVSEDANSEAQDHLGVDEAEEKAGKENGKEGADSSSASQYVTSVPIVIPSFVKKVLGDSECYADTICVVGKNTYYRACDRHGQYGVIYDRNRILVSAPCLHVNSYTSDNDQKQYVSVVGKTLLTDFSDARSLQRLASLSQKPPSFMNYQYNRQADFGKSVSYSLRVDFPKPSTLHGDRIGEWLVEKIFDAQQTSEEVPPASALHINYYPKAKNDWKYDGDINNHQKIAKTAANFYFARIKGEYGTKDEDYPISLSSLLNLHARVFNNRYMTYQQYTFEDNGGAHGYYTERLISYDHVHRREIDFKYLFRADCEKELLDILVTEAQKTPQFENWHPDVRDGVIAVDEGGNPTGGYNFPQPGLSENGVVFSFQPYAIDCFAAGAFHFTVPYHKVKHLLTQRGKWCVGISCNRQ